MMAAGWVVLDCNGIIVQGTAIIINMNTFQITYQINQVYPDIEEELCSKHTISFNQLHRAFQKTYHSQSATHFVVVNRVINLLRGQHLQLSMAMEQGLTIILAADADSNELNISSNILSEVVLEKSGKIIDNQHQPELVELAKRAVELAVDDMSLNKIRGGSLYLRFEPGESVASTKHQLLIGLFMAALVINDLVSEYEETQLLSKLRSLPEFQNNHILEQYFTHCSNRSLIVSKNETNTVVKLDSKIKMVFMNLSFLEEGLQYTGELGLADEGIEQLLGGLVDLMTLMNRVSEKQLQSIKHASVLEFIQNIVNMFKIKGFLFAGKYCIFLVQTYRYAEVIGRVSRLIHNHLALKSPPSSSSELEGRHRPSQVSSFLFSSVPSCGLAVLDPSSSLWF